MPVFLLMSSSGLGSSPRSCITFGCLVSLVSCSLWQFLSFYLSFITFVLLKSSSQLFCTVPFNLYLSNIFSLFFLKKLCSLVTEQKKILFKNPGLRSRTCGVKFRQYTHLESKFRNVSKVVKRKASPKLFTWEAFWKTE